ncbi:MAG: protein-L-isoaspartate O-methyltransferase [Sphingomonas sp.]|jgi:protein-L-isoaspartate(D-aspartate) O-methyltransferase|nr:protein-L-isoaspartate O-methyltransferase [Sphingomonas sp.]
MTIHSPVPDYAAARESMVDTQLRPQGVSYAPVVEAMATVRRELFVSDAARPLAYIDRTVPIGDGRSMSGPVVTGLLLTELVPVRGERALVIGCGTGYSAALLMEIGLEVTGLESSPELATLASDNGIDVVEGPLEQGLKKGSPYELILIDGAIGYIPDAIVAQLADQGRLGAALIDHGISRLAVGRKVGKGFAVQTIADAGAAALPGFAKPRTFTF